jgi:hypothetical protein
LVWALIVLLHVLISLAWKIVWRVGVGAVTWGVSLYVVLTGGNADIQGLIVALGTVFAGLGGWGGVV